MNQSAEVTTLLTVGYSAITVGSAVLYQNPGEVVPLIVMLIRAN